MKRIFLDVPDDLAKKIILEAFEKKVSKKSLLLKIVSDYFNHFKKEEKNERKKLG